ATKSDIKKFIKVIYSSEEVKKAAEALSKESAVSKGVITNIEDLDDIKNAPVVKMVDF
ncbi:MAG TPA: type II secretion system protein GspE, partial [Firmicutes bacterium]|nr:type II secretion system protein GspE [Bacillota bacterium]